MTLPGWLFQCPADQAAGVQTRDNVKPIVFMLGLASSKVLVVTACLEDEWKRRHVFKDTVRARLAKFFPLAHRCKA